VTRDQAHQLRTLVEASRQEVAMDTRQQKQATRVIAVSSGKGGVGKTNLVANLGITLAMAGCQTMILDADLGLANIDVVLGIAPQFTLAHVLAKQKSISDVIVEGPHKVRVIPGGFGLAGLADLPSSSREELIESLSDLDGMFDILLIDTSPGISPNVLRFILAAGEVIVVTTTEPTAMTDAYALIKVVSQQSRRVAIKLLVNMADEPREANEVIRTLTEVSKRFLGVQVKSYGHLPSDISLSRAVKKQVPLVLAFPYAALSRSFFALGEKVLADDQNEEAPKGARQFLWRMSTTP